MDSSTVKLDDRLKGEYPGTGDYAALKVHKHFSVGVGTTATEATLHVSSLASPGNLLYVSTGTDSAARVLAVKGEGRVGAGEFVAVDRVGHVGDGRRGRHQGLQLVAIQAHARVGQPRGARLDLLEPREVFLFTDHEEDELLAFVALAGALQDYDRAVVLGQRTFGKGVVQTVMNLPAGRRLRFTTGSWLTPLGRSLQRNRDRQGMPVAEDVDTLPRVTTAEGRSLDVYRGARIRVRGWVRDFNGPMIEITHPEQIEILVTN